MRKIFAFLLISFSIVYSQSEKSESILNLKNQISTNLYNSNQTEPLNLELEKKSAGLAIIYSLLLPGMGEMYAGNYASGKYFTIADAAIWGFFTGFTVYGNRMESNYKSYAAGFGGVDNTGKDDRYYAVIGDYVSIEQYNNEQELNRNFEEVYDVETHYWDWGTSDKRKEFRSTWTSSEQANNNIRFAVGALILNRVVSAINAVRLVSRYNKNIDEELSWNLSFGLLNNPDLPTGLNMSFYSRF
ncbi:MAG: hypothetical protein HND52_05080 [Ignavibacteriae bacterium]|jgi:TM2 domain-containing membrane protein YozV|nr:hypothetical protein [Ignavibacteriota bacterium]NOG97327.1 hypothetical protein [Ignavibacteriota bacterium]